MSTIFTASQTMEALVLKGLEEYVRKRAEEITESHKKQATEEIDRAVRDEVARVALSVSRFVSFRTMGPEIIITISDKRQ